jgi:flavin reductase (DIM6/NTAB) family NADH-FMN oxidoreductase RutF
MSKIAWKGGTLLAPVPAVLVSCGDMETSNVFTVAWTGIINSTPPKTYISVRPSRHSYGLIKERGEFVINLTTAIMAREVDYAGIYTGAKVDKWEKCGFTKVKSNEVMTPTIAESPLALECRVTEVIPMGSHDVFMADIVSVSCDEKIMDEKGRICLDRAGLLAYAHGEYFTLGERVGRFGFSTDKPGGKSDPRCAKRNSGNTGNGANSDGEKRPYYLDLIKKKRRKR